MRLVLVGQALIKKDPRIRWNDPYGTLRPVLETADVAFTNFEMAVVPGGDRCGLPEDYEVSLGTPALPAGRRPGNAGGPHAVAPAVMTFLADLGFNLMSLSNNHAWDLGDCGVAATRAAADASGVAHAGTGPDASTASAPTYLTVGDFTIALVAATTSHDERHAIGGFAYQGLNPTIGGYDEYRPWDGLLAEVIIRGGRAVRLDFTPLDLDEGETYRSDYDDLEFLSRRGLAQLATGPQADSILRRLHDLSGVYGVELEVSGSRATLDIARGGG